MKKVFIFVRCRVRCKGVDIHPEKGFFRDIGLYAALIFNICGITLRESDEIAIAITS